MTLAALLLALVSLGAVAYAVLSNHAAKAARREVNRLSHQDVLTGLSTRHALVDDLERLLAGDGRIGVVIVELGRFGAINETYGHEIGDAVMVAVAHKLQANLKPHERLYRHGGPQFVILIARLTSEAELDQRTADLQATIDLPLRVGPDKVRINSIAGMCMVEGGGVDVEEALQDAGIALHEALTREAPRVAYELSFRTKLTPATAEGRLLTALNNHEFGLVYVPMVGLSDNTLVGFEALLRWADPTRGMVNPAEFLKVLDETGLIVPVGAWMIEEACRQTKLWQDMFPKRELTNTISVSPRQVMQTDFCDVLSSAINSTGVTADRICLEIAEGSALRNADAMWTTLRCAKTLGVQLALDEFGVGFSSLNYIRSFEFDAVKIESTFVEGLVSSRDDQAIVGQIVGLAHALNLTAVAEGIDSREKAEALAGLGCDLAQGSYFSQPRSAEAAQAIIEKGRVVPGEDQKQPIDWQGR